MSRFSTHLKHRIDVFEHIDPEGAVSSIKRHISFLGPNVFILACAIIIASVGLNVNSIPVIIGAMLISPLMGPILGFGLGLGTNDTELVKEGLKNFAVMVTISIVASTLYFLITPLRLERPTELLARTSPTIYDVFIAFFGGLAGILETSRKDKGTVFAGVAIATALMPPLCTVGYGIASLNLHYIGGALYLFFINSIFIALATFLMVKYLRFPQVSVEEEQRYRRSRRTVFIILIVILVPSVFSAIKMVRDSNFESNVSKLINQNKSFGSSFIYDYETNTSVNPPTLDLYLAGETLSEEEKDMLYSLAESHGILRKQIVIHDDATISRQSLSESELIKHMIEQNEQTVSALHEKIDEMDKRLEDYEARELPSRIISREICAQFDGVTSVSLGRVDNIETASGEVTDQVIAIITSEAPLRSTEISRLERWLKVRLSTDNVIVLNQ